MSFLVSFVVVSLVLFQVPVRADKEILTNGKNLLSQKKYPAVIEQLEAWLAQNPKAKDLDLVNFQLGYAAFNSGDFPRALKYLSSEEVQSSNLSSYASFFRGLALKSQGQMAEAETELIKINLKESNIRLSNEVLYALGEIALQKKDFFKARQLLSKIERKARGTENYAAVIYQLARAEGGLKGKNRKCQWLRKLYAKYPGDQRVSEWGFNLSAVKFEGEPSGCSFDNEDFRDRIRSLLWLGLDKKAQQEISEYRQVRGAAESLAVDQVQAQFFLQEGEAQKAFALLKPYYSSMKKNLNFLLLFASAAARAGETQVAVGAYYSAFQISPKSKKGRNALYQSAFLSYQFQDYDGANRRFLEFIQLHAKSGLAKDARWHLSWLKYLRGDYEGAFKSFKEISQKTRGRRSRAAAQDRIQYWMGMSLLKQGKVDAAKNLFEKISRDPLLGYYSLAAQFRLKKISQLEPRPSRGLSQAHVVRSRFSVTDIMIPSIEDSTPVREDSEESFVLAEDQEDVAEIEEKTEEASPMDAGLVGTTDPSVEDLTGEFKNSQMNKKVALARDLVAVGLEDWARWDLFDVERKTRNKDHLKILMNEYIAVEQFHRSSYIGQVHFSSSRAKQGLEGARSLWEFTFPLAYQKYVDRAAKSFSIPRELIWGIMRAESSYRKDAISPVGALGLMQVMPLTGNRVAQLMGDKTFETPQLLNPEVAVRIGSRYLQRLMNTFDGSLPLVAAAYNAGPHRVKNWISGFGHIETDEFIEHIPFLETRNYVKKVVTNAHIYSQLYNSKKEVIRSLAEVLPVKFSEPITSKESWDDI